MTFSTPNPVAALGTASPTPDIVTIGPYFPSSTMNQWSVDVERTLWRDAALDVQYQGNHSYHLDSNWQKNAPLPGPGPIQSRRPNPLFGNIRAIENQAYSNYDGMNVVLVQRMRHGLMLQANYTWSHSLDQGQYAFGGGQIVNPYNWRADYGNSAADIRHRFVANYVWEMPFLKLSKNRAEHAALAGWSLAGTVTMQTGDPGERDDFPGHRQHRAERPAAESGGADPFHLRRRAGRLHQQRRLRSAGAIHLRQRGSEPLSRPGLVDFDTSLGKAFRIREGMAFQLRADAYNTFNHVNWGNPNGVWNSPQFGSITSAGPMRVFEITGRLSF